MNSNTARCRITANAAMIFKAHENSDLIMSYCDNKNDFSRYSYNLTRNYPQHRSSSQHVFTNLPIFTTKYLFCSSRFSFFVFVHFWQQSYENTKILHNLCLHFARQDGKKWKENHTTKVTKIPKTKSPKYGMNKTKDKDKNK